MPDSELIKRPEQYVAIGVVAYPGVKEDDVFEIAALRFDESGEKEGLSIIVNSGAALTDAMAQETGLTRE